MKKNNNKTITININLNFKGLPKLGHRGPPRFNPFGPPRFPLGSRRDLEKMSPEDPGFDDNIPFFWNRLGFEEE